MTTRLDLGRISAGRALIDSIFQNSPLFECPGLAGKVLVKLETANPVRSFKGRGSELVTAGLAERGETALVCASAGNLGQALAWSGRERGLEVTVVAASSAPEFKLNRMRDFGARLEVIDADFDQARVRAVEVASQRGIRLVEDSLDIETCEGAATIGLELVESGQQFDTVLVALGGGAMATGVGQVLKELAPEVEVVCVQPEAAPAMTLSWRERRVITTGTPNTIADGVAGRCPIPEVLDDLLQVADDALLVSEESIIAGMRLLFDRAGLVVEPSGALGIAALLENQERFADRRVVTILCGGNAQPERYREWVGLPG